MNSINRSAVIVVAKKPFLDWVNGLATGAPALTLEEIRRDPGVYLIPEYEGVAGAEGMLRDGFDTIFRDQLSQWWSDPAAWPANRTLALFNKWFAHHSHSTVRDTLSARLTRSNPG